MRVSDTTIRRLVEANLLPMTQIVPWAPWEIQRVDLDAEPVSGELLIRWDSGVFGRNC